MKLNTKIFLFLFGLTVVAAGIIGLSSYTIKSTQTHLNNLIEKDELFLSEVKDIYTQGLQRGQAIRNIILDPQDQKAIENFTTAADESEKIFNEIIPLASKYGVKDQVMKLKTLSEQDIQLQKEAADLAMKDPTEALKLIKTKETPVWREIKTSYFSTEKRVAAKFESNQAENNQTISFNLKMIFGFLGLFIVVSIVLFLYMRKIVTKPIIALSKDVDRLAGGDLTIKPAVASSKDEIGILMTSFNKMVGDLRELVSRVRDSSDDVAASAEELLAGAEQTNKATEQIASTMEELSAGTDEQVSGMNTASHLIQQMSEEFTSISAYTKKVTESANETLEKSTTGQESISVVTEQMNSIHEHVDELGEVVKGLGSRSQQIGDIIEVITGIAAQTNLLALNAAIEAARAGEQGRGFAVVADEVRKLAEQSALSAQQISELVQHIQIETEQAVTSMGTVTAEVLQGMNVVHGAGDAFEQIQVSINDVSSQIQEVSASVEELTGSTKTMIQSINTVSKVVEESSAGTQSISAATEEQLASMEEITSSASDLAHMAEDLKTTIGKFQI